MKTKIKNIFNKLRRTLVYSGYDVVLTTKLKPSSGNHRARYRGVKGYIAPDQLRIYVSRKLPVNDRVITLIHELLHELYPTWTEPRVERQSKSIFRHLTVPQLGFLQFFVMSRIEIGSMLKQRAPQHSPIC
ncbi:MAG: hypothetical protein V1826_00715 [bacterium]